MQHPFRCYCHATVWSLCSPVMCLLEWRRVIEWDNLKTQGLGLLLATIFSEERRFSHCLLSLFLRANTQTPDMHTEIWEPILEARHILMHSRSSTATTNITSNRQQVLKRAFCTKRNEYVLYKLNKREAKPPPPRALPVGHAC